MSTPCSNTCSPRCQISRQCQWLSWSFLLSSKPFPSRRSSLPHQGCQQGIKTALGRPWHVYRLFYASCVDDQHKASVFYTSITLDTSIASLDTLLLRNLGAGYRRLSLARTAPGCSEIPYTAHQQPLTYTSRSSAGEHGNLGDRRSQS